MRRPKETWILNGILVTQNTERWVGMSHLRIQDGEISEITSKKPRKIPKNAEVLDATGHTLIPGFVQGHVHLCQTLFKNLADDLELLDWLSKRIWVMEGAHTEETLYTSAILGIAELLSSGTTCILDMGTIRHTPSILEAVQKSGIRASVGKCLMDHPEQTPPYLRESTQEALREALSLYEKWNNKEDGRIRISYAPRFAISCTEKLLEEISRISAQQNALVHTHASENRKEIELVRKMVGQENIEYFQRLGLTSPRLVLAHCVWLNETEKRILKDTGTRVTHCPSSNLKLASGFAPIPELRSMGITVALGADGTPCNNNLNMFQEMRLAALIHKPRLGPTTLRATEALDMATREGAIALNWFDQIGSIEVGKKADLVALNLNTPQNYIPSDRKTDLDTVASAIVYSSSPQNVVWTMVDGNTLYHKGSLTTLPTIPVLMNQVQKSQKIILSGK